MDKQHYQSLYDSLIYNSCPLDGYRMEKHHILPRCLGGGDEKDNFIDLPVFIHAYAHYILTKIYPDNNSLKVAFFLMSGYSKTPVEYYTLNMQIALEESRLNSSHSSLVKKRMQSLGVSKYLWFNTESFLFRRCYSFELSREFNLDHRNLFAVSRGKEVSHKGWQCFPSQFSNKKAVAHIEHKKGGIKYIFVNIQTGEKFIGSTFSLSESYPDVSFQNLYKVISGERNHCGGWIPWNFFTYVNPLLKNNESTL